MFLKKKCSKNGNFIDRFCIQTFKSIPEDTLFYTVLARDSIFRYFLSYLGLAFIYINSEEKLEFELSATRGRPPSLSFKIQLFLLLVRLRLGLFQQDLEHTFDIHESTVSRFFATCLKFSHIRLSELSL